MSQPEPSLAVRFYRALLRLLPFDFRSEFGGDMEETFQAQRTATERDGGLEGLLRMWWATITDIVRMAPREHAAVLAHLPAIAGRCCWRSSAPPLSSS
jgi:hypothetical protein